MLEGTATLRRIAGWLIVNLRWLREQRALWMTLGVLASAFVYVFKWPPVEDGEDRLRYAGMALQFLGVATVVWGVEKTKREFDRPGSFMAFWLWLKRWPWRGPRVVGSVGAALGGVSANIRAHASATAALSRTIEERVAALEDSFRTVDRQIGETNAKVDRVRAEFSDALSRETLQRQTAVSGISKLVESVQTGGLDVSMAGLIWLAVGTVFSGITEELARWWNL